MCFWSASARRWGSRPPSNELPCVTFKPRAWKTHTLVGEHSTAWACQSQLLQISAGSSPTARSADFRATTASADLVLTATLQSIRRTRDWLQPWAQCGNSTPRRQSSAFSPCYNSCCCVGGSLQVKPAVAELGRSSQPQTLQLMANSPVSKSWGNSSK